MFTDEAWEMRGTLHKGDASTLNVYIRDIGGGVGGIASNPTSRNYKEIKYDGVEVQRSLLTRIPHEPPGRRNDGDTLIHEVGHWLSLYHA